LDKIKLHKLLNSKVDLYNQPSFIAADPISIPHRFTKLQDVEIAAFFAAIFAWGNRTTIINKTTELLQLMDNAPHHFVLQASAKELNRLEGFKHRTFNSTDLLYCVEFFNHHYSNNTSLENAFVKWMHKNDADVENALIGFHQYFFSLPHIPERTRKHIATPQKNSSCKRLNMFLRWMVRKDNCGVDFGIWEKIKPYQLICPLDVHVARVARNLGLLQRTQNDWQAAQELTANLRTLNMHDPVKYDFALFSLGVIEKY
jgi:uncharacterized protein (TIGR02757 family)